MMKRIKELEDENVRLVKMHTEERLKAELGNEVIEKNWVRDNNMYQIYI